MAGDRKYTRNKTFCDIYAKEGRENINRRRRHRRIANRIQSKMHRMTAHGMNTLGIGKQLQHHQSLAEKNGARDLPVKR